jgi:hypothetical protein
VEERPVVSMESSPLAATMRCRGQGVRELAREFSCGLNTPTPIQSSASKFARGRRLGFTAGVSHCVKTQSQTEFCFESAVNAFESRAKESFNLAVPGRAPLDPVDLTEIDEKDVPKDKLERVLTRHESTVYMVKDLIEPARPVQSDLGAF